MAKPISKTQTRLDQKTGLQLLTFVLTFVLTFAVAMFCLPASKAQAEYRAYELKIENTETNKGRTTISSLDHLQYARYYPVSKGERVLYVDSWMCRENTSHFKRVCPKPERAPAGAKPAANPPANPAVNPASNTPTNTSAAKTPPPT